MLNKIRRICGRFDELTESLADPEVISSPKRLAEIGRERGRLEEVVLAGRRFEEMTNQKAEAEEILKGDDPELAELAQADLEEAETELPRMEAELRLLLLPRDERDDKNVIVEVRAGTGGDEASLFAGDLYRMYMRYAETKGWKVQVLDSSLTELGGFKEIVFSVEGEEAYRLLKFESGVHRVQRVPETESSGRIHTSAVSVAILPEAEEVEVNIDPSELRIDVCRASGPGGQSVNTTDSAVRITHIPTGIVVRCQDEKSQHKNKARALKILRARLYDQKVEEEQNERAEARRSQIGSGDRSAKIRTYNFPQGRVTDHRIGLTLHKLDRILNGDLTELVDALTLASQEEMLKSED